ncbi:MAG: D-glycero-beta-D-manno-heptose 1,7-bisphosphate 7-phosphatase [Methylococcaceae bacterium]
MASSAVFLDRDGTLNVDKGYVHRIENWEWIPGAIDAIVALKKAGFLVIVITNQAGIARGYYDETDMTNLHTRINEELKQNSVTIDGFYHCPHHSEFGAIRECECRKPMPGLIYKAIQDFDIDLSLSWLVGDKVSDIQAGLAAGVKSILVLTGYGENDRALLRSDGIYVTDIVAASNYIISRV